ncbi:hypothetical protein RRG08_011162 [Elysia crispata]|uniref:Uncharacterized protein n=1 Tax=Elysia crispata TaxID=231223 RepID=A0AAE1A0I4_9GAST|nr:hypothetical protein RRG08_011162 [Elysia crispata]
MSSNLAWSLRLTAEVEWKPLKQASISSDSTGCALIVTSPSNCKRRELSSDAEWMRWRGEALGLHTYRGGDGKGGAWKRPG